MSATLFRVSRIRYSKSPPKDWRGWDYTKTLLGEVYIPDGMFCDEIDFWIRSRYPEATCYESAWHSSYWGV